MNKSKSILVLGLLAVLGLIIGTERAQAQPYTLPVQPYSTWSGGTTNGATTLSWTVVSAYSVNAGTPVVTFISGSSDKAGSKIQFEKVTTNTVANYANSTVTIPVVATNGFASGDTIVIRHLPMDTYEVRTLTASTGTTNLVTTVAPNGTVNIGDMLYDMTTTGVGMIPWGATTNTLSGTCLFAGQRGMPLLIQLDGSSTATLNAVTCQFSP